MPSGVPVGEPIGPVLLNELQIHAEVPKAYHPVIEDGTYDELKECVFRVCSIRVCDILLEDLEAECRAIGIEIQLHRRRWYYARNVRCMTAVELRLGFHRQHRVMDDLQGFLQYLSRKYEFVYNRLSTSYCRVPPVEGRYNFEYDYGQTVEVCAELTWPYWT